MATGYERYTIIDHADLLTKSKAFYVNNGWTISNADSLNYVITKGSVSHRVITLNHSSYDGWFPTTTDTSRITFGLTIGFSDTSSVQVAAIVGPLGAASTSIDVTMDFFSFDDGSVLISANVVAGSTRWAHAYSGFLESVGDSTTYFDKIISGSFPAACDLDYAYNAYPMYCKGFHTSTSYNSYTGFLRSNYTIHSVTGTNAFEGVVNTTSRTLYAGNSTFVRYNSEWIRGYTTATHSYPYNVANTFVFDGVTFYHAKSHPLNATAALYTYSAYDKSILPSPIYLPALNTEEAPLIMGQVKNLYYISKFPNYTRGEEVQVGVYKFRCYPLSSLDSVTTAAWDSQALAVRVE